MRQINRILDRCLRPHIGSWPTWRVCVFSGMALGIGLAMGLAAGIGRSPWVAGGTALAGVLICILIGLSTLVVTGVENYTFYHYQAGILAGTAFLLWFTAQPILVYLDLIALAVAAALACGRLGCQAAGCCHGRPYKWGICYAERPYRALGFTPHLLGIRLFPVQLLESLWLWVLVCSGSWMVLAGWPAGSVCAWYVIGYGIGRFCLEMWRGDTARPYFGPLSAAQWTSLLWLSGILIGEGTGIIPFIPWHLALICICFILAGALCIPSIRAWYMLLSPAHVREIAQALANNPFPSVSKVYVWHTSLGYRISAGQDPAHHIYHYTLSHDHNNLTARKARLFASLIVYLRHPGCEKQIIQGHHDTFHVVIQSWHNVSDRPLPPEPVSVKV